LGVDILTFLSPTGLIPGCPSCRVHSGFYFAWQSVESTIEEELEEQFALYPDYGLLVTGHSMGGALATLLVLTLKVYF
jgi:putative lipase involved disintegration of autophagic bodies